MTKDLPGRSRTLAGAVTTPLVITRHRLNVTSRSGSAVCCGTVSRLPPIDYANPRRPPLRVTPVPDPIPDPAAVGCVGRSIFWLTWLLLVGGGILFLLYGERLF